MKRSSLLIFVFSFLIVSGCNDSDNSGGVSEDLRLLLDDIVKCTMLEKQIPGLSVTALKNGKVIYQEGFGKADIASGEVVTADTTFSIGSITKVFTAIAVLQLIEDGLASLDDPVGMYLTDLPNPELGVRTIRDLLSMSSGIPRDYTMCNAGPKAGEACVSDAGFVRNPCGEGFFCVYPREQITYITSIYGASEVNPLLFEGGAEYFYSNLNFILLGLVVEELSGLPYEKYVKDNLLDPLGMRNTGPSTIPLTLIPGAALGYRIVAEDPGPDAVDCITFVDPPDNCGAEPPSGVKCAVISNNELTAPVQSFSSGWLATTQTDMAKFEKALHNLSPVLLNLESYDEMWTNRRLNDGVYERFGLGWDVCSELQDIVCPKSVDPAIGGDITAPADTEPAGEIGKVVQKDGGVAGFASQIVRYLDDGLTVIVFVNATSPKEGSLAFEPVTLADEIAETIRQNED